MHFKEIIFYLPMEVYLLSKYTSPSDIPEAFWLDATENQR